MTPPVYLYQLNTTHRWPLPISRSMNATDVAASQSVSRAWHRRTPHCCACVSTRSLRRLHCASAEFLLTLPLDRRKEGEGGGQRCDDERDSKRHGRSSSLLYLPARARGITRRSCLHRRHRRHRAAIARTPTANAPPRRARFCLRLRVRATTNRCSPNALLAVVFSL